MGLSDWHNVMDDARSIGCRKIQFIGGEPTVHPDLPALIEHAGQAGFRYCEVFTNATLLGQDLLDLFEKCGVRVATSFYSFHPQIHDEITGEKGSFETTVEGIRQLVARRIPLRAGVIRMEQNAAHVKETMKFLRRLGVKRVGADRVRGVGRGRRFVPDVPPRAELCGQCWRRTLCIGPNGDAYPCVFSRFVSVGNVLTDGVNAIVNGAELHAFRDAAYLGKLEGGRTR
jgi:MoaA/NifB/PqqE/SkfB family radical SAM enzyme